MAKQLAPTDTDYLHDILGVLESIESLLERLGNRVDEMATNLDKIAQMREWDSRQKRRR